MVQSWLAFLALTAFATTAQSANVPNQYLIELKPSRAPITPLDIERVINVKVLDRVRPNVYLIEKVTKQPAELVVRSLRANKLVSIAEPNGIVHSFRTPSDPEYKNLWGLANTGLVDKDGTRGIKGVDVQAEKAWDITTGAKHVTVAVIDSGIDFTHPDLADNAWVNTLEANGQPGVDDDNNGYVDDINGFNFVANNGISKDDFGHGSHCAGTIGAKGDNGSGVAGLSWNVRLMAVKFLDQFGSGTIANAIKAIDYARVMKADILSNSWGGTGQSELLKKAVEDTKTAGQLFVSAAGNSQSSNDNEPIQPASFPVDNMIAVAAIDNRGNLADFSNYGEKSVHLAAPGVNIFSTVPGGFEYTSGTSMAAPHVAGIAALVLAKHPKFTYVDIKKRLLESVRPLVSLKNKVMTAGLIDAYHAVSGTKPPATDPNDPAAWAKTQPYQLSTAHPYPNEANEILTVRVPGAKRISLHFPKFQTEETYDFVQFFNGANESLGKWTGVHDGEFSPVADGDTLILKLISDGSNTEYGFDADRVVYEIAEPAPSPQPTPEPLPSPVSDPSPTPEPTPVFH